MRVKIAKWGNSAGIRLPKALLQDAGLAPGADLDAEVQGGHIVLKPARSRYTLEALMAQFPADVALEEVDTGPPVGLEDD